MHVVQPFSYDSAFGSGTQQPTVIGGNSQAGQRQLRLDTGFSPTPHWQVSWSSTYDLATRQFGYHYVRLERDLHRWHASFAFSKAPNGNFAFNFYISLIDQPDIKFDYDQQTFLNR